MSNVHDPAGSVDPLTLSATALVQQFRSGQRGVVEHAQVVIAQVERWRVLNAFITFDADRFLDEARQLERCGNVGGALYGIPIPIKDSINTAQYPTTGGTPALRTFQPTENAAIITRLRSAGALVLGKTNLHELSYGWTSNNRAFGAVRNPYGLDRIPGGSSGGTAAAVAARLAPIGLAEDTEGSIRVPAALCGLAGFRPSTGRYANEGTLPISPVFDQVGPVATHAEDLLLFDQVAGPDPTAIAPRSLAGVRFAILKEALWSDLHPAVEQATREGLQRLQAAGAILVDAQFPALVALVDAITAPVQSHDVRIALAGYLQHYRAGLGFAEVISAASPDIQATFRHSVFVGSPGFITEARYAQIVRALLPQLRQAFAAFYASTQTDAIVFPTTRITAPQIGAEGPADIGGRCIDFTRALAGNISSGSTAGLPGLVLPVGFDQKGLPISMEFDGPAGSDRRLLALAPALEKALGRLAPPKQLT